jgi:hypothetical protein
MPTVEAAASARVTEPWRRRSRCAISARFLLELLTRDEEKVDVDTMEYRFDIERGSGHESMPLQTGCKAAPI